MINNKTSRIPSHIVLWTRCAAISLSKFMVGYSLAIINTIGQRVVNNFQWNKEETVTNLAWTTSILPLGIMFGACATIPLVKNLGRLTLILIINLTSSAGFILCTVVNYPTLLIGRFIVGAACGLAVSVAPLYVTELTPVEKRSQTAALICVGITLGILASYSWGFGVDIRNSTSWFIWRFIFAFPIVTNVAQLILFAIVIIESPNYYILTKNDDKKAIESLTKMYKQEYVNKELDIIKLEQTTILHSHGIIQTAKDFMRPLLVAVSMAFFMQFSGIGAIIFFSNRIFLLSGLTQYYAELYTFFIGVVNVIGAILVIFLVKITTPRILLLAGFSILAMDLIALAITLMVEAYVPARFLVLVFSFVFNASIGSVLFIIIPQIVPPAGNNIAYIFYGLAAFIVGYTFLYIEESSIEAQGAFFIYAGGCIIAIIHALFELPETKNKNFYEIMKFYDKNHKYSVPSVPQPATIQIPVPVYPHRIRHKATDSEVGMIIINLNNNEPISVQKVFENGI